MSAAAALRARLAAHSPARARWERFLAGLPLDPDALDEVRPTGPNDVIVCGSSRSGTTLATAALFQPPRVVTVMEPWDGMRLPPAALFASLRRELATGVLRRGRLDIAALHAEHVTRWCRDGERPVPVEADADTVVAVKWPVWWRWLDRLPDTRFVVCVRDPVETIRSYAGTGGRLADGRDYPTAFNAAMLRTLDATARRRPPEPPGSPLDEAWLRRIDLFDHVHEQLLPHLGRANVHTLRYERWFVEPDAVLDELGAFLGVSLAAPSVTITAPRSRPPATDPLGDAIRARCRTAAALGYA
ncbi:MAG: sulfotransferase [Acidimicrobiales bacterium]|nr:sulfotransferase [Acidimicrobiales bacterium]